MIIQTALIFFQKLLQSFIIKFSQEWVDPSILTKIDFITSAIKAEQTFENYPIFEVGLKINVWNIEIDQNP